MILQHLVPINPNSMDETSSLKGSLYPRYILYVRHLQNMNFMYRLKTSQQMIR